MAIANYNANGNIALDAKNKGLVTGLIVRICKRVSYSGRIVNPPCPLSKGELLRRTEFIPSFLKGELIKRNRYFDIEFIPPFLKGVREI
jgi:hypothetical protein